MLRLFIGLPLPIQIRQILLARMGGVPGVRWQSDAQLHLTLRFLGNVSKHEAADIDLALQGIPVMPFDLALSSTGLFGTLAKPRMIWAGVTHSAPLTALNKKLESAAVRAGCPPETRKYSPHITLARCDRGASRINHFLGDSGGLTSPPWTVDHFVMFRSYLGHRAAAYESVARYPAATLG